LSRYHTHIKIGGYCRMTQEKVMELVFFYLIRGYENSWKWVIQS
jgi:hypothetical protein